MPQPGLFSSIGARLQGVLRALQGAPAPQPLPARYTGASVQPKVLMIVHNPSVASEGGRRLTEIFGWHDPGALARRYIDDLREASGGYVGYRIVERIEADWYPPKVDGFRYTDETYLRAWRTHTQRQPDAIDYPAQVRFFDLLGRYQRGEIDEAWFFAFPYSGDAESTMAGRGAFWLNSNPVPGTNTGPGRMVIMAFNYERDVGSMLENYGHRIESIMSRVYAQAAQDRWQLFTRYDLTSPGRAQCGNVHFAPNSLRDYDWGNPRRVPSYCDDWYSYPALPGNARLVNRSEWGGGDTRLHHLWWLRHIPRAEGETEGIANNWWRYIVDPNLAP